MAMLETPSRIWRRIEAGEAHIGDMPSLPSLPQFDDSAIDDVDLESSRDRLSLSLSHLSNSPPVQSTPTVTSHAPTRSSIRPSSSMSSTARFANSLHTNRSTKSAKSAAGSRGASRGGIPDMETSFDVPGISLPCPTDESDASQEMVMDSSDDFPDISLPSHHIEPSIRHDGEQELSLTDALQSVSRTPSPELHMSYVEEPVEKAPALPRKYDYSVSLRSELQPSPKLAGFTNVSVRRPLARNRTPSLSRTTPSPSSQSSNSTPPSARSIALPASASPSPLRSTLQLTGGDFDDDDQLQESLKGRDSSLPNATEEHESNAEMGQLDVSEREPTFSSEEALSIPSMGSLNIRSPQSLSVPFTSPVPSVAFTPTPAFQARPIARFKPMPSIQQLQEDGTTANEDPSTPHVRRKSFLLSVINSSARPRLSFPTPHAASPIQNHVFAGATPGPRAALRQGRRSSHPLAQAYTFQPSTPSSGSAGNGAGLLTPAGSSSSFVSTASSHDLTVHPRANASFDPVTGTQGVGRFNAGKLNSYLHGLNRRLQEENEVLVERLRMQQEENLRLMAKFSGGGELSGVAEVSAEGWLLERDVLERQVEGLKADVDAGENEKNGLEKQLEEERDARMRDKDRWKERMGEVEKGVGDIVRGLERKLEESEQKAARVGDVEEQARKAEAKLEGLEAKCALLTERAEKAERVMESERELGGELRQAHETLSNLSSELLSVKGQLGVAEERLAEERARADALEEGLQTTVLQVHELRAELQVAHDAMDGSRDQIQELGQHIQELKEECEEKHMRVQALEAEVERVGRLALEMEEALNECEQRIVEDEEHGVDLKTKIASLEQELESQALKSSLGRSSSTSPSSGTSNAEVDALDAELEAANKEIGRLNALLNQSPARKAIDKAKDARIDMLEKERENLLERINVLNGAKAVNATPIKMFNGSGMSPMHRHLMSMVAPKTPGGPLRDLSWLQNVTENPDASPLLAEISRLQKELDSANESIDDKLDKLEEAGLGVVGLTRGLEDARSRIAVLEDEIARLNRREERRARRLQRARCVKCRFKMDLSTVERGLDGDESSMEASMSSQFTDPPTPPSKSTEALKAKLQNVNSQLETMQNEWEEERRRLLGEKALLQDAAQRLNREMDSARKEATEAARAATRAKTGSEEELDKAKRVIDGLEENLRAERSQLRAISTQQARATREKDDILTQLKRTESDMHDVRRQLEQAKSKNSNLEAKLQENVNMEQKARSLDAELARNKEAIDQLREERSLLAKEHASLQQRFSSNTEQLDELRRKQSSSQTSHDNRRLQLDIYSAEIEDLRSQVFAQNNQLTVLQTEKSRIAAERRDVQQSVVALEADLCRVKQDAEVFGRDLKYLRAEKDRLEKTHREELAGHERLRKQNQTQIRLLGEQLEIQRESANKASERFASHVCDADEAALSALRLQHNKECKGLIVQIRYLKAKFTRESSLRADLGYQKQYLLILLSKYEDSEKRVLASIAQIGYPLSQPAAQPRKRTLRSIGIMAIFSIRMKRASDQWREQRASRQAVNDALQEVRKRRQTET